MACSSLYNVVRFYLFLAHFFSLHMIILLFFSEKSYKIIIFKLIIQLCSILAILRQFIVYNLGLLILFLF